MNAFSRLCRDQVSTGEAIVKLAMGFDRHPYVASPDRETCFDCVALVNRLTGANVPEAWMREGGRLPFESRAPGDARPGDLITFVMPWPARPHHVAVMTRGNDVDDPRAQVFGPWYGHAAATCWLHAWRPYVAGAYRIGGAL